MADPDTRHVRTRITAWGLVALAASSCRIARLLERGAAVATPRGANLPSQEVTDFEMKESDTGSPSGSWSPSTPPPIPAASSSPATW